MLSGRRILVVEDFARLREVWVQALREVGCIVDQAGSVAEAVALEGPYDVLVLDMGLPDGRGTDVAAHWPDTPALTVSSSGGFADLMKPFGIMDLLAALEVRVAHRRDDAGHPADAR